MENLPNISYTEVPGNSVKNILAFASLIIGILGCVIPYPLFCLLGLYYLELVRELGSKNADLLQLAVPITLSLAGFAAIIVGILANNPKRSNMAIAGILIGITTILCVLLPFALLALLSYICSVDAMSCQ